MVDYGVAYKVADAVSSKMLNVGYWLMRDETAETVRMDSESIQKFNKSNMTKLTRDAYLYDLVGFSNALAYGVCVRRSVMWATPEEKEALTAIYVNEPVVYLEEYKEWVKIRCVYYEGWVKKCYVARFYDVDDWLACMNMKNFVVVTGDYLMLQDIRLDMGVRLELDAGYWDNHRKSSVEGEEVIGYYYNYAVKVPVRGNDGFVQYITGMLPVSKDVHVGCLPYTGANVLRQAYKMLGNVYGWGGTLCSRDCSAVIMDIHRCFGFVMPRDVSGQMRMTSCRTLRFEDVDDWKMLRAGDIVGWKACGAKETLDEARRTSDCISSHTMIYLGFDGEHYVLSAVGGSYGSCIINSVEQLRDNGFNWKESASYAKLLRW